MSSLSRSFLVVAGCVSSIVVVGGCAKKEPAPATAAPSTQPVVAEETLPTNKRQTLMQADKLRNEGLDLKQQGEKLKAEGKQDEGDQLLRQADMKLTEADALWAKGAQMAD